MIKVKTQVLKFRHLGLISHLVIDKLQLKRNS